MLRLMDVSKEYDGVVAVDSLSIEFPVGSVSALVGPNGAGKTTVLNMITGLERPTRGAIYLDGQRIDGQKPWQMAARGIARLFQDTRVFDSLTLEENLAVAPVSRNGLSPELHSIRQHLLEAAEFSRRPGLPAVELSFGQKKLLALARLIHPDFRMLLLDEPTAGVHADLHPAVIAMLRVWAGEGRSAIVVEHNHGFVENVAHRVLTMSSGRLSGDCARQPEKVAG